ncbi:leucine-rich repeat-containing protein 24 [Chelonus insularis]|uniref:leucine-rich repeat-containing protein 24 n=1 Tax=Chelonus insularis TaxID=460826 RepID=UPI00158E937F|nr:leucine-rich repeat-containing protein 24 [Chelonus insularis]XP_034937586.1 leucine-rich repeat-containing protein 24 [Chelonus insularis]XP_034937587.1 leucine-rich repeat-containing protein 24 [Chelonus insularis]XP_034937588.1 leucine-rich repeat-containing protein 24 [Chelonus insularis]XP_034937589.1 leucine-rich repeat-containing protein 24 [Chelonus insularis]
MRQPVTTFFCLGLIFMMGNGQETWDCDPPCNCKWSSGKKTADCMRQNYSQIPDYLSSDIQNLDLTGNRINHLTAGAFSRVGLINLHKLVMKDCGIKTIDKDAFTGLKIVIEIDLSNNNITTLVPGTFYDTQKLRVLLLNNNYLMSLESGLFHDLVHLQKVDISNNQLERISDKTFKNLTGFLTLTLDSNNLTTVKWGTFDNLPKLGSLGLRNNPWNCNCHLKKFRNWVIERKLYTKPTTCKQPEMLEGKMWDEVDSEAFACRPKILSIGPSPRLEIGDSVTMWCHAAGIPRPKLSWMHRSRILSNSTKRHAGDRRYVLTERHEWLNLTITDIVASDKGEYICKAESLGGSVERNTSISIVGDAESGGAGFISLPLALGLGVTLLILLLFFLTLCTWYCRRRRVRHDEKNADVTSLEHHGLGEQEKSLITAINPVVKPPRRYEAPSVTSHGTEMTELNRTLLDNDSVFADGVGSIIGVVGGMVDDERERATPEFESGTLTRGASYRHYPPDLLAFSGGRGASPTSQASTIPDNSRPPNQSFGSPSSGQYPAFKTLPHNRSATSYSPAIPVMPRHGYVTIPRRPRAPSWSSGPPTSPNKMLEPVYDNLGRRTTADGSSVLSLNESPEPSTTSIRIRPLPGTPTTHYNSIQRSNPNILNVSPLDRSAPEGAAEWFTKLPDEMENRIQSETSTSTLGRKIPPRPPPKPKKKSTNGPLYEDEGEDGTEV